MLENNSRFETKEGETCSFDCSKLAQLVKEEVGKRTHDEFCAERKIGRTTLSTVLNCKLSGPPTLSTIDRIAGSNVQLAEKMREACGYSEEAIKRIKKTPRASHKTKSNAILPDFWGGMITAMAFVLDLLIRNGYVKHFQSERRDDGSFVIDSINGYSLFGIPAFCSSNSQQDEVFTSALRMLTAEIHRQIKNKTHKDNNGVLIVFTNSDLLYNKFLVALSLITSSPLRIAVVLSNDGRRVARQKEVIPYTAGDMADDASAFPINFLVDQA